MPIFDEAAAVAMRTAVAVAIARADGDEIPENYATELDHDEISDWSAYLADKALAALKPFLGEIPSPDKGGE